MRNVVRCATAVLIVALLLGTATATATTTATAAASTSRSVPRMTLSVAPRYPRIGAPAYLTGSVTGRFGAATGWVRFRFDGRVITGCRHVTLRRGRARCTAPRSLGSVRHFALGYFGSARYRSGWVYRTVYS